MKRDHGSLRQRPTPWLEPGNVTTFACRREDAKE